MLDGVLRNFDLGKVPLCMFVQGKLGRASCLQCGESKLGDDTHLEDKPHLHLQVSVLDLDLDLDQSSQVEALKSWLKTWGPDHYQHSPQQPCEIFFPPTHPLGLRSFNNAARGAHVQVDN